MNLLRLAVFVALALAVTYVLVHFFNLPNVGAIIIGFFIGGAFILIFLVSSRSRR